MINTHTSDLPTSSLMKGLDTLRDKGDIKALSSFLSKLSTPTFQNHPDTVAVIELIAYTMFLISVPDALWPAPIND